MLAMSNKQGIVEASVPGLADFARVSVDECRAAIAKLEAPDPDSRTKVLDGRRIVPVDGGWELVNHAKYREKMNKEERTQYLAIAQRRHRAKADLSTNVNTSQQKSSLSTHAEASPYPSPIAPPSGERVEVPEKSKAIRPRKVHFDALCEVCGLNPSGLTNGEAGRIGKALQGITSAIKLLNPEADDQTIADEIRKRASNYRRNMPSVMLTATALEANWGASQSINQNNGRPPITTHGMSEIDVLRQELNQLNAIRIHVRTPEQQAMIEQKTEQLKALKEKAKG